MTKYILHGGNDRVMNKENDMFFEEMFNGLTGNIKIVLNYFAKEESFWENLFKNDVQRILRISKDKKITIELADKNNFINQIKNSDVIYFRGGDTLLLKDNLKKIKKLNYLLKNKVIAGSSAGAYILCKYCFGNISNKVIKGFGILNLKIFCHFDQSKLNLVEKLKNYKEKDLEILILPEFKYQVIYK